MLILGKLKSDVFLLFLFFTGKRVLLYNKTIREERLTFGGPNRAKQKHIDWVLGAVVPVVSDFMLWLYSCQV